MQMDLEKHVESGSSTFLYGACIPFVTSAGVTVPHMLVCQHFRLASWPNIVSFQDRVEMTDVDKETHVLTFYGMLVRPVLYRGILMVGL